MQQFLKTVLLALALVGCGGGGGGGGGSSSAGGNAENGAIPVVPAAPDMPAPAILAPKYSWALAATASPLVTRGVTITDANEVVVVGSTKGDGKLLTQTISAPGGGGNQDILYLRLDAQGNAKTQRAMGSTGDDYAFDVVAAGNNGVFVTGQTTGAVTLGASAADPNVSVTTGNTVYNAPFVALYNGLDQVQWVLSGTSSTSTGGYGNEVAAAPDGGAVVQGSFKGSLNFGTQYKVQAPTGVSSAQSFVLATTSKGATKWLSSVTGPGRAAVRGVAVSAAIGATAGQTAISGDFNGTITFSSKTTANMTLTGSDSANTGSSAPGDCFVALLDTNGVPVWAKAFGSTGADKCRAAGFDSGGNVYIGGTYSGTVTFGNSITLTSRGGADIFVAKLSPTDGTPLWAQSMGSTGDDEGAEIEVSTTGDVTLSAQGRTGITFPDGQVLNFSGTDRSAFVARLDSLGQFLWLAPSISSGDSVNYALARGADDGIVVVGTFAPGTMNFSGITLNSSTASGSTTDSYIARLGASPAAARTDIDIEAAAAYAATTGTGAVVVADGTQILAERYYTTLKKTYIASTAEGIASGSKTFTCALAVAAQDRSVLNIEDLASTKIAAWLPGGTAPDNSFKQLIKLRDLLSISSGLRAGGQSGSNLNGTDTYAQAIGMRSDFAPDTTAAIYTPNDFQAFLAYFELATGGSYAPYSQTDPTLVIQGGQDPIAYLKSTVFTPLGMDLDGSVSAAWQRDKYGKPNIAGGATITPREWIKYGQLLLNRGSYNGAQVLSASGVDRCLNYQTNAFLGYGLSVWLNRDVGNTYDPNADNVGSMLTITGWASGGRFAPDAPTDVAMAAGTGGYRMYIIPSRNLVAIKFGGGQDNDPTKSADNEFLKRLLKTGQ